MRRHRCSGFGFLLTAFTRLEPQRSFEELAPLTVVDLGALVLHMVCQTKFLLKPGFDFWTLIRYKKTWVPMFNTAVDFKCH